MKNNKENELRIIKPINYFYVGCIILITFIGMTYFVMWYANTKNQKQDITLATQIFFQINSNELDNYLVENPNALIYISASNEDHLTFEYELQTLVNNYYIKDHFVYLDLAKIDNTSFYNHVYKDLFSKNLKKQMASFTSYTNIIYIADGKIEELLYNSKQEPNIKDVKNFLVKKGVISNND